MATTGTLPIENASLRSPPLRDGIGREVGYIRVSLTDDCNYSCLFCKPGGGTESCRPMRRLSVHETIRLCRIFSRMGIANFKITGGEPMLHPRILTILKRLKNETAAQCVTLTTNGSTLLHHAGSLADIGVDGINVSLNAVSTDGYRRITGSGQPVERIIDGILHARRVGLNVKLNMVPIKGVNDAELMPVVDFAMRHGLYLRFIELMPLGPGKQYAGMTRAEVMTLIASRYGRPRQIAERFGNGPAVYYSIGDGAHIFGYIAALSKKFCSTCNRIRLNSAGFLRTCLHNNHGADLLPLLDSGANDSALEQEIRAAVAQKPTGHHLESTDSDCETDTPMFRIGG